ncbi:MAG: hypothetical protein A2Z42_02260 [Candidatus Woykebacteria bacterium RBG_19FT_COMBO_43_10]|uniref:Uncharacterized protein n=1 Tax=Candidatus Woykebacteria bacterium RBG_19FT_COMBO_43_10 TaxID=1802598 RepID=A0A1G1WJM2_9BACT|nr:MAG: hypothetical protein A2Z42_02260 [Candidatus Woykebacteria bacterium RBG_19FT_COMBO_43_10]
MPSAFTLLSSSFSINKICLETEIEPVSAVTKAVLLEENLTSPPMAVATAIQKVFRLEEESHKQQKASLVMT